jgi:VanZ family protein
MSARSPLVAWRLSLYGAALGFTLLALLPVDRLPPVPLFNWWDKAQHALAFGVLTLLARLGWPKGSVWRQALGLVAYGVLIEFAQAATGWRHGEVADAVADAVGVVAGLGAAALWALRSGSGGAERP